MSNMATGRWANYSTNGCVLPKPPTPPACTACMSPSIMRRRLTWCRCRASISAPSRVPCGACGLARWSIYCRSSNEIGSTFAGEQGLHFITLGPLAVAKANIAAYKSALQKRGAPVQPKAEFSGGAVIGVQRHIFLADTDDEAHRFGKPAMDVHLAHLNWLRVKHGDTGLTSRLNVPRGANFEACIEDHTVIAGSPATVRAEIERQVAKLGINYLLAYLFLGTMSLADALRSLDLFRSEVMPHLAKL